MMETLEKQLVKKGEIQIKLLQIEVKQIERQKLLPEKRQQSLQT